VSRNIFHIIIFIVLLFMSQRVFAEKITSSMCGYGIDTLTGEIARSPFAHIRCQIVPKEHIRERFILVDKLSTLFKLLQIPENKHFFENYFVYKIFNNPHLNRYTITLAHFLEKEMYENRCTNTLPSDFNATDDYGDAYVSSVTNGAQMLILYHIPTHSQTEYEKVKKALLKLLAKKDPKLLQKYLITQKSIRYKEYFSAKLPLEPAIDIAKSFLQKSDFLQAAARSPYPYTYQTIFYEPEKTVSAHTKLHEVIQLALQIKQLQNDCIYYRTHPNEFENDGNETARYLACRRVQNALSRLMHTYTSANLSGMPLLPKRHRGFTGIKKIKIPSDTIHLKLQTPFAKIDPKKTLKIRLNADLSILHRRQLVRLATTLEADLAHYKNAEKYTKIVCDNYVNFRAAQFSDIDTQFGRLEIIFKYDHYRNEQKSTGTGLIKEAVCGYKTDGKGVFEIYCKDIVYKRVNLKVKSEE